MKKVALVIGLVALFASCGTSTTGTAPKADSTTVKKDTVIVKADSVKADTTKKVK